MLGLTLAATAIYTGFQPEAAVSASETRETVSFIENKLATTPEVKFPDRTKEYKEAVAYDTEQARIKAEAEAKAAAEAELARQRLAYGSNATNMGANTGDVWYRLRLCESGNNYATNTGNGFYGAYQFDIQTWANYGGYHIPSDAPPSVQDAKAHETQAVRGWSPWPVCGPRAASGSSS